MKWLVIGDGIQGKKRKLSLGEKCLGIYDPFTSTSDFSSFEDIPEFEAALICTPNSTKSDYLDYFLSSGKHCMVEKPLHTIEKVRLDYLNKLALKNQLAFYVAYNHRFEDSINDFKTALQDERVGTPYFTYMKYGNGTVKDIISSPWKDYSTGLIDDLGSHLFDLYEFLFQSFPRDLKVEAELKFESHNPDYVRISGKNCLIELSYLSWKSEFVIETICTKGTLKLKGLPKWGSCTFEVHSRVFPSGVPIVDRKEFPPHDKTWSREHEYFEHLVQQRVYGLAAKDLEMSNLFMEIGKY